MNPLIDQSKPFGVISFIHSDGTTHVFSSGINSLSGSRLSAFDSNAPSIDDSMKWVKSVFRDIHAKATVLSTQGRLAERRNG